MRVWLVVLLFDCSIGCLFVRLIDCLFVFLLLCWLCVFVWLIVDYVVVWSDCRLGG